MADLNHVTLSGNLVADPELRSTPSGKNVCQLRIGTKLRGGKDRSMFTDVTVWGGQKDFDLAETVARVFSKGDRVQMTARLDYDEWEKDGAKRSKHFIVAEDIVLPPKSATAAAAPNTDPEF